MANGNGNVNLPGVPQGTYYLWIYTRIDNQVLLWLQPVQLNNGANLVKLDQSNATVDK